MESAENNVRVRFAPSPTGYLHVGSLRTALYNYLFAKKEGGTYVLRVEDTDQKRFVEGSMESLIRSLDSMFVGADEGVVLENDTVTEKGDHGPYEQSKRLALYQEHIEKLLSAHQAYYCFCTHERLEELRNEQAKNKQAPKYDKHCLSLSQEEREQKLTEKVPYVIRLNVNPERGAVVFEDLVRGKVSIHTKDVDDQVLMKSDGFPTYHLANVVDDRLMGITHVIRGEEWLPSTPKHVLLYEAFGWRAPLFAHLPLLLNADKSKLSKRQGDVAVEDYLKKGYLKEALLNFVALLGWNPGKGSTQEIFTLDELVAAFDFAQIHKGGAVFDQKKLDWMNGEYIKRLSLDELYARVLDLGIMESDFFRDVSAEKKSKTFLKKVLAVEHDRLVRLSDVGVQNPFFFSSDLSYETHMLHWKDNDATTTRLALEQSLALLAGFDEATWEDPKHIEEKLLEAAGEKRGDLLSPLRVALTGAPRSPSPAQVAWVLGRKESLARLKKAIAKLST
ncbi:MAG: glutamate--tRNA ligase [Candidatus Moranbacteria bacterium]|nr:glutamate--tRNA ligase [Candidatus Moranbacteria bacterium]